MAGVLVPDALWKLIEPLLPIPSSKPQGGRPRLTDRACLAGIIFVLRSGIPWRMLPKALGCGSGMTCWRRLRDWQKDGIGDLIHFALLDRLSRDGQIDWSRAVVARRPSLRRRVHSLCFACPSNLASAGHAQYETWQRAGAMALGCGTHFRMVESVSPPAV